MRKMRQLTIRGYSKAIERRIRELSVNEGISLNQAAIRLLNKGAGIPSSSEPYPRIGTALDSFIGIWSDEETRQFLKDTEVFSHIDEELWQ